MSSESPNRKVLDYPNRTPRIPYARQAHPICVVENADEVTLVLETPPKFQLVWERACEAAVGVGGTLLFIGVLCSAAHPGPRDGLSDWVLWAGFILVLLALDAWLILRLRAAIRFGGRPAAIRAWSGGVEAFTPRGGLEHEWEWPRRDIVNVTVTCRRLALFEKNVLSRWNTMLEVAIELRNSDQVTLCYRTRGEPIEIDPALLSRVLGPESVYTRNPNNEGNCTTINL